ncbi:alpha/beta-type small acid-soluble spore protein [Crassaminicella thermophila]|uniref:Alpha/beta-type small acid-soluble spore protein n=1 Tax=Crassaminicella thermophila TaxID=2599308 RepID=A0A5C0SI48_CRATE|nr:alpha/beta-type small acid-soluble spore protein [Crassaminicella thermophila]QEK12878.1 alpha/beta-type small acid-soluble spore protein [Crassaminicella thermophila]
MAKKPVVKEARMALNEFKEEIANELGISMLNKNLSSNITSRQAGQMGGKLGGEMTKRLIENAEKSMAYRSDLLPPDLD